MSVVAVSFKKQKTAYEIYQCDCSSACALPTSRRQLAVHGRPCHLGQPEAQRQEHPRHLRSEERRVGEEGRCRWWPFHLKNRRLHTRYISVTAVQRVLCRPPGVSSPCTGALATSGNRKLSDKNILAI